MWKGITAFACCILIIWWWNNPSTDSTMRGIAQPKIGGSVQVANSEKPSGNPLGTVRTVMTQGYGVGSHAPAAVWGGVDLAVDSDGDGQAEGQSTEGTPIYATHSGITRVVPQSWPAGNYLSISNEHYKTAYAHLSAFAVEGGVTVATGQLVGYVGSTGNSSGPHLHYEVWQDGVNVNPLDFGALP